VGGIAAHQHGVVTRAQLLGRLRPLHHGVYLAGPLAPPLARELSAVLARG
jgi:hypothetical protein